jgi:ketosteroid isomerase-like protein
MSAAGIGIDQVRAFLEAYAAAFQRQDKDAVADLYAYPAHVVTHDGGVALVSSLDLIAAENVG